MLRLAFSFQKVFLLWFVCASCDVTVAKVTPFFFSKKEDNGVNKHVNRLWCYVNSSESVIVTLTIKKRKSGIYPHWPQVCFDLNLKCIRYVYVWHQRLYKYTPSRC